MTATMAHVPSLTDLTGRLTDSRLGALHRSSHEPLRRALNTVPEWVEIVHRLNALEALRPPVPPEDAPVIELVLWLDAAVRGDAVPNLAEAVQHAGRVHRDTTAQALLVRAHRQIAADLAAQLDRAVRDSAEDIHRHLTSELRNVVDRGRQVADAFGLTADAAIAAGCVQEYQVAEQVRREFRVFRAIRNVLDAAFGWPTGPDLPVAYPELRWIANPADPEVFEHWRPWVLDGYLIDANNPQRRRRLDPPWPQTPGLRPEEEAEAWLRFLVTCPAAVAWLPSRHDYTTAAHALQEYASQLRVPPGERSRMHVELAPPRPPEWVEKDELRGHRRTRKASR